MMNILINDLPMRNSRGVETTGCGGEGEEGKGEIIAARRVDDS